MGEQQARQENSSQGSRNPLASSDKDPLSDSFLSASGFPFQTLPSPVLTLLLTSVTISCAEALPKAMVFLEDGLISSSEASFPPCSCHKELLTMPLASLFWWQKPPSPHLGLLCSTQKETRKLLVYFSCFVKNNSRHYKVCVINMHM